MADKDTFKQAGGELAVLAFQGRGVAGCRRRYKLYFPKYASADSDVERWPEGEERSSSICHASSQRLVPSNPERPFEKPVAEHSPIGSRIEPEDRFLRTFSGYAYRDKKRIRRRRITVVTSALEQRYMFPPYVWLHLPRLIKAEDFLLAVDDHIEIGQNVFAQNPSQPAAQSLKVRQALNRDQDGSYGLSSDLDQVCGHNFHNRAVYGRSEAGTTSGPEMERSGKRWLNDGHLRAGIHDELERPRAIQRHRDGHLRMGKTVVSYWRHISWAPGLAEH